MAYPQSCSRLSRVPLPRKAFYLFSPFVCPSFIHLNKKEALCHKRNSSFSPTLLSVRFSSLSSSVRDSVTRTNASAAAYVATFSFSFVFTRPPPSAVSSDVCRDLVGSLRNSHLNTAVTFARVCVCVLFSSCVFSFLSPFPLTTTRAEIHEKKNQPKGPILFFFPHPRNSFTSLFLTTCLVVCVCVVLLFLPLSS